MLARVAERLSPHASEKPATNRAEFRSEDIALELAKSVLTQRGIERVLAEFEEKKDALKTNLQITEESKVKQIQKLENWRDLEIQKIQTSAGAGWLNINLWQQQREILREIRQSGNLAQIIQDQHILATYQLIQKAETDAQKYQDRADYVEIDGSKAYYRTRTFGEKFIADQLGGFGSKAVVSTLRGGSKILATGLGALALGGSVIASPVLAGVGGFVGGVANKYLGLRREVSVREQKVALGIELDQSKTSINFSELVELFTQNPKEFVIKINQINAALDKGDLALRLDDWEKIKTFLDIEKLAIDAHRLNILIYQAVVKLLNIKRVEALKQISNNEKPQIALTNINQYVEDRLKQASARRAAILRDSKQMARMVGAGVIGAGLGAGLNFGTKYFGINNWIQEHITSYTARSVEFASEKIAEGLNQWQNTIAQGSNHLQTVAIHHIDQFLANHPPSSAASAAEIAQPNNHSVNPYTIDDEDSNQGVEQQEAETEDALLNALLARRELLYSLFSNGTFTFDIIDKDGGIQTIERMINPNTPVTYLYDHMENGEYIPGDIPVGYPTLLNYTINPKLQPYLPPDASLDAPLKSVFQSLPKYNIGNNIFVSGHVADQYIESTSANSTWENSTFGILPKLADDTVTFTISGGEGGKEPIQLEFIVRKIEKYNPNTVDLGERYDPFNNLGITQLILGTCDDRMIYVDGNGVTQSNGRIMFVLEPTQETLDSYSWLGPLGVTPKSNLNLSADSILNPFGGTVGDTEEVVRSTPILNPFGGTVGDTISPDTFLANLPLAIEIRPVDESQLQNTFNTLKTLIRPELDLHNAESVAKDAFFRSIDTPEKADQMIALIDEMISKVNRQDAEWLEQIRYAIPQIFDPKDPLIRSIQTSNEFANKLNLPSIPLQSQNGFVKISLWSYQEFNRQNTDLNESWLLLKLMQANDLENLNRYYYAMQIFTQKSQFEIYNKDLTLKMNNYLDQLEDGILLLSDPLAWGSKHWGIEAGIGVVLAGGSYLGFDSLLYYKDTKPFLRNLVNILNRLNGKTGFVFKYDRPRTIVETKNFIQNILDELPYMRGIMSPTDIDMTRKGLRFIQKMLSNQFSHDFDKTQWGYYQIYLGLMDKAWDKAQARRQSESNSSIPGLSQFI